MPNDNRVSLRSAPTHSTTAQFARFLADPNIRSMLGRSARKAVEGAKSAYARYRTPRITEKTEIRVERVPRISSTKVPRSRIASQPSATPTVVKRRELVRPINDTGPGFGIYSFKLTPSDPMFPWLSLVAPNWSQYRFKKLTFKWVPTIGQFSTTGAIGSIIFGYDPDPQGSQLTTRTQVISLESSIEKRTDKPVSLSCMSGHVLDWYQIEANTDDGFNNIGRFYLVVSDAPAATGTQLGDLWVEYEVELRKPSLYDSTGALAQTSKYTSSVADATAATSRFYGTTAVGSGILADIVKLTPLSNSFTIMTPGTYLLSTVWFYSTANITTLPTFVLTNCTGYGYFVGAGLTAVDRIANVNSTSASASIAVVYYDVSAGPAVITLASGLAGMLNAVSLTTVLKLPEGISKPDPQSDKIRTIVQQILSESPLSISSFSTHHDSHFSKDHDFDETDSVSSTTPNNWGRPNGPRR